MKTLLVTALTVLFMNPTAQADQLFAKQTRVISNQKTKVEVARVTQVIPLVKKDGLQVNITVLDLGGSTDLSPTERLYLTVYAKGEMFSTDAAFELGDVLAVESAKRVAGGLYELIVLAYNDEGVGKVTVRIDARKVVTDIQKIECQGFDCAASQNFRSTVRVQTK